MKFAVTLFGLLAMQSLSAQAPNQTTDPQLTDLLARHAAAMGGADAWRELRSYTMVTSSVHEGDTLRMLATMKRPDRYRLDFQVGATHTIKSYDGKEGWVWTNGEFAPMRPGEAVEMAEETDFFGELVLAAERGHDLALLGEEKLDGKPVFRIRLVKNARDTQYYLLNQETALVEMTAEHSEDSAWQGTFFRTTFADYREVNGLQFPFEQKLYAGDTLLRTFHLEQVSPNAFVADFAFSRLNVGPTDYRGQMLQKWQNAADYLVQVVERMPEADLDFRPTAEEMTFREQWLHNLYHMTGFSQRFLNAPAFARNDDLVRESQSPTLSRAELLQLTRDAFDYARAAIAELPEARYAELVPFFSGPVTRQQIINLLHDHLTHHRAQMIVYLRLKGIEPPAYVGW